jgi:hypothetical protein
MERLTLMKTDVLVVGGGLGGVAAALAALRRGARVILSEPTDWLGGQLTSQAVPPDEHAWIEQFGCTASYRRLRERIRGFYRSNYPLSQAAQRERHLNPGQGRVSRLCHEPWIAEAVLREMLAPYQAASRLTLLMGHSPVAADTERDVVRAVTLRAADGAALVVEASYVLDATETGDLLPLTGTEHVTGFESREQTGEPHAPGQAQPLNMQAVAHCFAIDHCVGEDHTIDKPADYAYWRSYQPAFWPDRLLSFTAPEPRTLRPSTRHFHPNGDDGRQTIEADQSKDPGDADLWVFRRIFARNLYSPGFADSDITLVNWPMIDYFDGPIFGTEDAAEHARAARRLSLSMLYWLQVEAPRPDGGTGWPGLRLRGDVLGTTDGLAKIPYIRESRRIQACYTIVEQDLSYAVRGDAGAVSYPDSVGVGMYRIDLHPSTGGDNYIDIASCPFQIPLGAILPQRMDNLLPAAKNIGTTHITNGCYRMHPVEWNIGEVAGTVAAESIRCRVPPRAFRDDPVRLTDLQRQLAADGVELQFPTIKGY